MFLSLLLKQNSNFSVRKDTNFNLQNKISEAQIPPVFNYLNLGSVSWGQNHNRTTNTNPPHAFPKKVRICRHFQSSYRQSFMHFFSLRIRFCFSKAYKYKPCIFEHICKRIFMHSVFVFTPTCFRLKFYRLLHTLTSKNIATFVRVQKQT